MTRIDPTIARAIALAASVAGLAGCGDGPSCEKAMARAGELRKLDDGEIALSIRRCKQDGWSSAMRGCIAEADDEEELAACAAKSRRRTSSGAFESYMERSKMSEAELHLRKIEKAVKTEYVETSSFPVGDAALTPSTPCCEGPRHKCPARPEDWAGVPVWDALDFEIDEPTYFQYRYAADARHVEAQAIGDLDCDGNTVSYKLVCDVVAGDPMCELARPARAD